MVAFNDIVDVFGTVLVQQEISLPVSLHEEVLGR